MNVDFITAIKLFFANYANFNGRSTRAEFWFAMLFCFIASMALEFVPFSFLSGIFSLAIIIPTYAITTRRFHDAGYSGWWVVGFFVGGCVCAAIIMGPMMGDIIKIASNPDDAEEIVLNMIKNNVATTCIGFIISLALSIWELIILVTPSKPDNQYGPNPYGEEA